MDSFFPNYCSVCDKTIENCCSGLYCSAECRMRDSNPDVSSVHDHEHCTKLASSRSSRKSSVSHAKAFSLNYPSVFGTSLNSPSHISSHIPFSSLQIPSSVPDLSLSEDEDIVSEDYDVPVLSLESSYGLPIVR